MRSKILSVVCLASLAGLLLTGVACGGGYSPAPAPEPYPEPAPAPVPAPLPEPVGGAAVSDQVLHDRVHEALENAPDLDASDIGVRVENGNVYLSGTVPTAAQRELAHNVAHGVEGVSRVFYDDLTVR
ncbi:MAG TPA: BON domain-containing protein [Thermoanaerobaculia bacterium]